MKILIGIWHPAHVHFFKNIIPKLTTKGHNVKVITRPKEITLSLLDSFHIKYEVVGGFEKNLAGKFLHMFKILNEIRIKVKELKQRYSDEVFSQRTSAYDPISIYEFIECFSEKLHGGEIIVTGSSGLSVEVFYTHFKNKIGQKTFLTTGLGAMGYGLPALLGASEATNKKVILFESDGSLMMNLQELQSLKSRGRDKLIFVMNNGGYASIRATQRNYFNGRLVATDPNSGLEIPEINKIAVCFGFDYCKISDFREMPKTLSEVIGRSGPVICEVVLQDDEVLMPKCSVFRQVDNTLVSAPLEDMSPLLSLEELSEVMEGKIEPLSQTIRAQ